MSALPPTDTTIARIYAAWEKRENRPPRSHLGASTIGRECERELWLTFRWADYPQYEGRLLRLFNSGHLAEPRFVADLEAAGVTVHTIDAETGKQFLFADHGGHFGGSMDGAGLGFAEAPKTWHVLEFKTHSEKSFTSLTKLGVKAAKFEHWAQMQTYMQKFGIDRAFYLAVNKNTDELYAERIEYDAKAAAALTDKAGRIIFAAEPPQGISDSPAHFKCKFCNMAAVCHASAFPKANCRTCVYATPEPDGDARWTCSFHKKDLTVDDQRAGCGEHLFIPPILRQEPTDSAGGWIQYPAFVNIAATHDELPPGVPTMTSAELAAVTPDQLPAILAVKQHVGEGATP